MLQKHYSKYTNKFIELHLSASDATPINFHLIATKWCCAALIWHWCILDYNSIYRSLYRYRFIMKNIGFCSRTKKWPKLNSQNGFKRNVKREITIWICCFMLEYWFRFLPRLQRTWLIKTFFRILHSTRVLLTIFSIVLYQTT